MVKRARATQTATEGVVKSKKIAATLGLDARLTRDKLRLNQEQVSEMIGVSRTSYAEMERGDGARAPLELWVKLGFVLGRPLAVSFSRDLSADGNAASPRDAGHLEAQELVLRLARAHGRRLLNLHWAMLPETTFRRHAVRRAQTTTIARRTDRLTD